MLVSRFFKLEKTQPELDFVDVDVSRDKRLFIDPYAIEIRQDELSSELAHHVVTFFEDVLQSLRNEDNFRAQYLTKNLGEPQETFLGMSRGRPQGRGVGRFQADQLLRALQHSRAFETGLLQDLAETELFIRGISSDKISDLTTNVIRGPLITYTQAQCALHGMKMNEGVAVGPIWTSDERRWTQKYHRLPVVRGRPVILVPKVVVRRRMSLDSQEYYNETVLGFLRSEHLSANSGLVRVLRSGERVVRKKDLKAEHPFSKDLLTEITQRNPRLLDFYKQLKGARGALDNEDFQDDFNESAFSRHLIASLRKIRRGTAAATEYHNVIAGILTFIFYPDLVAPKLEQQLHQGRKRIDIAFTNWATSGFFNTVKTARQTAARYVVIECKNYSDEIGNPEFDQLAGRFSPARGRFGLLCCRSVHDTGAILARSRDAVQDDRGVIIVLDDDDVIRILENIAERNRAFIGPFLERRYREIVF